MHPRPCLPPSRIASQPNSGIYLSVLSPESHVATSFPTSPPAHTVIYTTPTTIAPLSPQQSPQRLFSRNKTSEYSSAAAYSSLQNKSIHTAPDRPGKSPAAGKSPHPYIPILSYPIHLCLHHRCACACACVRFDRVSWWIDGAVLGVRGGL
jgi:hypothetical protein